MSVWCNRKKFSGFHRSIMVSTSLYVSSDSYSRWFCQIAALTMFVNRSGSNTGWRQKLEHFPDLASAMLRDKQMHTFGGCQSSSSKTCEAAKTTQTEHQKNSTTSPLFQHEGQKMPKIPHGQIWANGMWGHKVEECLLSVWSNQFLRRIVTDCLPPTLQQSMVCRGTDRTFSWPCSWLWLEMFLFPSIYSTLLIPTVLTYDLLLFCGRVECGK